ncbi:MAG: triacylglycerol lipase [Blastococcus sp.]|jgi:triacylglycerol esterase/lipase EstA (alpha/beta hydrolase family)|nr:triacylglycerol lipase [Blastococcus sp.]
MRQTLVVLGVLCALTLSMAPAEAASAPAFTVSKAALAAATHCDHGAAAGRRTVLLVHGTGATDSEAWSWNYEKALPAAGFGVCTVTLPQRALGDFSVSAQYAAYAARQAYRISGRDIAILGHSQGGLLAVWIAKFWPDVARHATDVIGLAANVRGTQLANTLCAAGSCSPIAWQMRRGSLVTNAATNAPLPTTTSFTSIGSRTDEVVFPQPDVSSFPGARAILVQDVCPGRAADHGSLLSDAVAYQLVLDALTHAGPARPARINRATCLQATMPGVDPLAATGFANTIVALSVGLLNAPTYVDHEPPVPAYAAPYAG